MALREVYARFGVEVEGQKELHDLDEAADKTAEHLEHGEKAAHEAHGTMHKLGEAIEGLVGIWAGSELIGTINETVEGLAHLKDISEQTGVSTDDLQFYGFVVGQVGGDVSDFDQALTGLQRSLKGSAGATGQHAAALTKLGVQYKNLATGQPRELNELLPEIFENFGKLKNENEEAAVATDLFGRSGLKMLPVLRQGKKGLEEYRKTFAESGGAASLEQIEKAEEYEKAVKRLSAAFGTMKTDLVVGVIPTLEKIVDFTTHAITGFEEWSKKTTLAENSTFALAAALGGPLLGALSPFLKSGLKFAGIYLAVDDLLGFLQGKDSEIGAVLDAMFGNGTAKVVQEWCADAKGLFDAFVADTDAAYVALGDSQESWVDRGIAGFSLLWSQGGNVFNAIGEGWESMLADMGIAIDRFFLKVYQGWNDLIQNVFGSSVVGEFLHIDTTTAQDEMAALKAKQDELGQRAYEREQARDQKRQAAQAALPPEKRIGGAEGPASLRDENGNVRGNAREAVAEHREAFDIKSAPRQVEVAKDVRAAGVTATYNDQKKIELHFATGTDKETIAKIRGEVAQIMKDQNREALQILTQRAAGK